MEASKLRGWTLNTTTAFIIPRATDPLGQWGVYFLSAVPVKLGREVDVDSGAHPWPLARSWASPGRYLVCTVAYSSLIWQSHFDMQGHLLYKATFLWTSDKWVNSIIVSTAQSCYRFTTSQSSWWDHVFCLHLSSTWDKNGFFYFCCFLLVHFVLRKKILTSSPSQLTFSPSSLPQYLRERSLVLNIVKGTQAGLLPIKKTITKKAKQKLKPEQNKIKPHTF